MLSSVQARHVRLFLLPTSTLASQPRRKMTAPVSQNIVWHEGVTQEQREELTGQRGVTIWFTGLSGQSSLLSLALHEPSFDTVGPLRPVIALSLTIRTRRAPFRDPQLPASRPSRALSNSSCCSARSAPSASTETMSASASTRTSVSRPRTAKRTSAASERCANCPCFSPKCRD